MTKKTPLTTVIKEGTGPRSMHRQRTLDALDRIDEQDHKYGKRKGEAAVVQLDSLDLERFDRMVILDGIRKDQACALVAKMARCSRDEAAERIMALIDRGLMTVGIHEGQIRVGITKDGWQTLSSKLR